jgi:hypothetical protein
VATPRARRPLVVLWIVPDDVVVEFVAEIVSRKGAKIRKDIKVFCVLADLCAFE